MKLSVGAVTDRAFVSSEGEESHFEFVNFHLSNSRLSPVHLMDSAFGSPGRYTAEILRRLQRHAPSVDGYLVVNPRFRLEASSLAAVARAARQTSGQAAVISDRSGRVVGTVFRAPVADEDFLTLSALSAFDPELDAQFLNTVFGWRTEQVKLSHLDAGSHDANGFLLGSFDRAANALSATLAIEALGSRPAGAELGGARRSLRHIAVCPYHAGDILFLCQALQAEPSATAVVALEDYMPILQEELPWALAIPVHARVPNRDGFYGGNEHGFLLELVKQARGNWAGKGMKLDGVFHLLRPHRDYGRTHFHLRQALWFALGGDTERQPDPFPVERLQRRHIRSTENRRSRVVLHFDAGWDLKSYPPRQRQPLITLLRDRGFSPVVVGKEEPELTGCAFAPFRDLYGYRDLIADCAAVIGVDSFPAHYAATYGVPTVHLFASTHPRNSEFPASAITATLHHDLACVPCGHSSVCPLDQGNTCRAWSPPHAILQTLVALVGSPKADAVLGEVRDPREALELAARLGTERAFPPPGKPLPEEERVRLQEAFRSQFGMEEVVRCALCGSPERKVLGEKTGTPIVECAGCGLWYTQRRVLESELPRLYSEAYWDKFMLSHGYPMGAERYGFDYDHALERVAYVKRFIDRGASLDIGCGLGAFARRLNENGFRAAGMDMPLIVRRARRFSGVELMTEFADGARFDLMTGFDVFEHLYRPRETLHAWVERLNPGGVLVLETFRIDCQEVERQRLAHEDVKPLEHPHMFRESHLREVLSRAKLELLDLTYPDGPDRARVRIAARKAAEDRTWKS